jgi:hypothetical protein
VYKKNQGRDSKMKKVTACLEKSNNLLFWTLEQAESSFHAAVDTALPTIALLEAPISSIDKVLCKSLDVVQQRYHQSVYPQKS